MSSNNEDIFTELEQSRKLPPEDFVDRVMEALPERPDRTWRERLGMVWPSNGKWLIPATAGALAAALVVLGFSIVARRPARAATVSVTFTLHAPAAEQVELAGSFNDWRTGEIVLSRPTADGPWTVTMELTAGRHEYLFLVNGERWVTDPNALVCRPDGFGNRNAVIEI